MLDKSDASSLAHIQWDTRIFATVANTTLAVLQRYLSSTDGDLDHRRRIHLTKSRTPSHVDNGVALRMRQVLMGGINGSLRHLALGIGRRNPKIKIGSDVLGMSKLIQMIHLHRMTGANGKGRNKSQVRTQGIMQLQSQNESGQLGSRAQGVGANLGPIEIACIRPRC